MSPALSNFLKVSFPPILALSHSHLPILILTNSLFLTLTPSHLPIFSHPHPLTLSSSCNNHVLGLSHRCNVSKVTKKQDIPTLRIASLIATTFISHAITSSLIILRVISLKDMHIFLNFIELRKKKEYLKGT